ncbi:MAG TPA: LamG-like jellyroll fold domain-containing protein, partial [bacterium]|nr:LamG-like jellyroll fold domain-containing protein [bacterium]
VWFNKDIGYWGSGSGGGHFHGGSSYNMAAAFLIAPPGSSDVGQTNAVVYPLNWWATGAPSDTSLSSIELQLFYYYGNNSSGQHTNLRTGFFANQLGSSPNGWHHLAVVNDLGGNTLAFYVDGNRVYSGPALDVSTFGSGADQGIIKWTFTGNSTLLNNAWGSMDELYIYQRALSAAEVQQLYTSP